MHKTRRFTRSFLLFAALITLAAASSRAADNAAPPTEADLLAVLRSGQPADKAMACKQLSVYGSEQAVPALAELLSDPQLASWARIALEAIPGPAADEALRKAMGSLQGMLLVGTINSIGVRRDAQAVDPLIGRLQDPDAEVASAAAVALGNIGNPAATKALRGSLTGAPAKVRTAVAEGCVLCAERMLAAGQSSDAAALYDEVRRADVPKQRVVEATRGAILARKSGGIELLLEQLRSPDKVFFQLGLGTARELSGPEVAAALAAEVPGAAPQRAALLLMALADRNDKAVLPAVLEAVKSGPEQVRIAAIGALPRLGDESCIPTLLQIATSGEPELAQAAKQALADLSGEKVDASIASRLANADGKTLAVLLEAVGERRIEATTALLVAVENPDPAVRAAALTALGATVGPSGLPTLVSFVVSPKNPDDAPAAQQALRAAATRMPDREACAKELAAAMPKASVASQAALVEILAAVAGTTALKTIGAAAKSPAPELQDTASRVLGTWMSLDAAPVLLDLAKNAPGGKYQVRAVRGYIRLAKQFPMSDPQRADMCQKALEVSGNPAEKQLVLKVLELYPTKDTLQLAINAAQVPGLKPDAVRAALIIATKLNGKSIDTRELLSQLKFEPVKLEIIKAEFGSGSMQKDVTEALKQQAADKRLILLKSPTYAANFGGDPAPGLVKQLKVQYRMNGKAGEATFPENACVVLPMPK
jgi:HEAT repeat protein